MFRGGWGGGAGGVRAAVVRPKGRRQGGRGRGSDGGWTPAAWTQTHDAGARTAAMWRWRGAHPRLCDSARRAPRRYGRRRFLTTRRRLAELSHFRSPGCVAFSPAVDSVRGTRPARSGSHRRDRFIPARAGNAVVACRRREVAAVHPRACGERRAVAHDRAPEHGSSPRVRGTRERRRGGDRGGRFIPARAGNARTAPAGPRGGSVHPRACGERGAARAASRSRRGSSPRVRGTHLDLPVETTMCRFIPARAGNAA